MGSIDGCFRCFSLSLVCPRKWGCGLNDYAVAKGPRRGLCADLAILDRGGKIKVAAEFKYEPDHRRQDILRQKLPLVGWKDMEKDIARIRTFVEPGVIESGYTVFIDEGGYFRHRDAHLGSNWIDWPKRESRSAPSILFSRVVRSPNAVIANEERRVIQGDSASAAP